MTTVKEDTILLGSGDLYLGQVDPNATETEIQAALVNVGAISGGATHPRAGHQQAGDPAKAVGYVRLLRDRGLRL